MVFRARQAKACRARCVSGCGVVLTPGTLRDQQGLSRIVEERDDR